MNFLDIGEVSRKSGVPASALRYYEELGLIRSAGRRGLRRQFEPDIVLQLDLIALAQEAGFSLQSIALMRNSEGRTEFARSDLKAQAERISRQIADLGALRDMLLHMAECPAPSHLACPSFRKLLQDAREHRGGTRPHRTPKKGARQ